VGVSVSHRGEYIIMITDRFLVPLGNPIINWVLLDLTLRFNEPGSGLFTAPGWPSLREQLIPGSRVVVMRYQAEQPLDGGQFVFCGPVENVLYERSDDGENAGVGMVSCHFSDDLAEVVSRLTYPDPGLTPEAQVSDTWTFTGNAETGLRNLVNLNAGPGALTARQMPSLTLGAVAGVGTDVTVTTQRMEPLGDVMRRVALAGGGLGFRTRQTTTAISFEVFSPTDRSGEVRFSFNLGTARYIGYEQQSPSATVVVVGGQGEGADRYVTERVDAAAAAAWGRREVLLSRPGNDAVDLLTADANAKLAESAETARLQTNVSDSHTQRFGVHYGLGDLVAVESYPGEQLIDVVRGVHIQAWPTAGDMIQPMIGSQAASSDPAWIQRLRAIDSRVGRLERTVVPAA
jgi:Siphovirus ReqiPepy6 Gp37-like protein